MESLHKSLILPCETRNRELDAKLLLGCAAVERGFQVFIGAKREINMQAMSLPRSIYVQKSLSKKSYRMYKILDRVGHRIVAGDEEGLTYYSREYYLDERVYSGCLDRTRGLLAWGVENADVWRAHPGYHAIPLAVTGNPRVDLLRPELRAFFDDEVEEIRDRLGSFVLVNLNFTDMNHFHPGLSYAQLLLDDAPESAQCGESLALRAARHLQIIYRSFLEMVPPLAKAFPNRTFVLRPHPSENHEIWRRVAVDCPNVHVIHQGNVVPWLIAAAAVIHNSCTTAIEAYCLGTPPIAYRTAVSKGLELELPNLFSYCASDPAELRKLVDAACDGTISGDRAEEERRRALVDHHMTGLEGSLVSDRIADTLDGYYSEWRNEPVGSQWSRLVGKMQGRVRSFEKMVNWVRPGHNNNRGFVQHMFEDLTPQDIDLRLALFRKSLGRFDRVRSRQVAHNVFELSG